MKFFETLAQTFAGKPIDWDELEEALIRADLGVPTTTRILKKLQDREAWSLLGISDVVKVAREELLSILPKQSEPIRPLSGKPKTILIVGVNGTGKTTSTAKLARYLQVGAVQLTPSTYCFARGGRHISRGGDRATWNLGRTPRC